MYSQFFSHDYDARRSPHLLRLRKEMGMEGIGIYWCLIEFLYERDNSIPLSEIDLICYDLRVEEDTLLRVINDFDLFEVKDGIFSSPSVARRLAERSEISEKRRKAVQSRTDRQGSSTNVLQKSTSVDFCKTNDLQKSTSAYNKKEKEKEKENNIIPPLPPCGGKERQKKFEFDLEKLPDWVSAPLAPAFWRWVEYKKSRGQGYANEKTAKICFSQLAKYSGGDATRAEEIVNFSVGNNYAGLFTPEGRAGALAQNNMILKTEGGGARW